MAAMKGTPRKPKRALKVKKKTLRDLPVREEGSQIKAGLARRIVPSGAIAELT